MTDKDERQLNCQYELDPRRRLSEIKGQLQTLMRQKKKYDEEKLNQDSDFLQSEINALRNAIIDINREIINQTQTKKRLRVEMTNLRSRSGVRYSNTAIALREKKRYEAELKKAYKTEEYRELARREIRSIEAALPVLKEEDEYKARLKVAEDAQQAATVRRKILEENLNKNLRKQTENKQLLSENAEKLPQIEATIESLRSERERLLFSTASSSSNGKRSRRRLLSNQPKLLDSPNTDAQTPIREFSSLAEDCLEHDKIQHEDRLNKVNTLINYFREKLTEHGLTNDQICSTPSSDLVSPLFQPITASEELSILSSYMEDPRSDNTLLSKNTTEESPRAIAMKLPRNFALLNLNSSTTNDIIHSPYSNGNEIEYKKELSSDILDKYGGQPKKIKQSSLTGKKQKRNRKNFAITHNPQMIALYDNVRSSTGNSDTFPSMPMFEYDLLTTIQSLEYIKQSLESYLHDLSLVCIKSSMDSERQSKSEIEDDDIRDSVLDTFSEASSLVAEPRKISIPRVINNLEGRLSISSDDKKTLTSSPSPPSSNKDDNEASNSYSVPPLTYNPLIDRQISDEGYRSVQIDPQQQIGETSSNRNSPLLIRSKSYNCTEKVDQWLSNTKPTASPSAISMSISYQTDFQATDNEGPNRNNLGVQFNRPSQTQ